MTPTMLTKVKRVFPAYTLISLSCLTLDSCIYLFLILIELPIPVSATLGYVCGLVMSYILLTKIGVNKEKENVYIKRAVHTLTGIIGIAVTFLTALLTSSYFTQNAILVKGASVALSFTVVILLRTKYVFD
jgi:putative flippase GtrA